MGTRSSRVDQIEATSEVDVMVPMCSGVGVLVRSAHRRSLCLCVPKSCHLGVMIKNR